MYSGIYKRRQVNNAGFTLIEVLIAVVILAIAAIPIMHAFGSTAKTTSRALIKSRATNVAENIMEDLRVSDIDSVVEKYKMSAEDPSIPDKYTVTLKSAAEGDDYKIFDSVKDKDIYEALKEKGYNVEITVDPTNFSRINAINFADFDEVSNEYSAIYVMPDNLDAIAKEYYVKAAEESGIDNKEIEDWTIKREIRVDIEKAGTPLIDDEGNSVEQVDVFVTVAYLYTGDKADTLKKSDITQRLVSRKKIFSNSASKKALKSVFIMYNPLSFYTKNKGYSYESSGDIIVIHNRDSVKTDLYVAAQGLNKNYLDQNGLLLQIYEKTIKDDITGETVQPITLYTNLYDRNDFEGEKKEGAKTTPVGCYLNLGTPSQNPQSSDGVFDVSAWNGLKNKKGSKKNIADTEALHARTLEGKYLNPKEIENKIYDVTVKVWRGDNSVSDDTTDDQVEVTLTGTLVKK